MKPGSIFTMITSVTVTGRRGTNNITKKVPSGLIPAPINFYDLVKSVSRSVNKINLFFSKQWLGSIRRIIKPNIIQVGVTSDARNGLRGPVCVRPGQRHRRHRLATQSTAPRAPEH